MSKSKDPAEQDVDRSSKATARHTNEADLLNRLLIDAGACINDDEADTLFDVGKAYLDSNGILRVKGTGVYIALADAGLIEEAQRRTSGGGAEGPVPEHNDETASVDFEVQRATSSLDEKEQRTQDQSRSDHKSER